MGKVNKGNTANNTANASKGKAVAIAAPVVAAPAAPVVAAPAAPAAPVVAVVPVTASTTLATRTTKATGAFAQIWAYLAANAGQPVPVAKAALLAMGLNATTIACQMRRHALANGNRTVAGYYGRSKAHAATMLANPAPVPVIGSTPANT